MNTIEETEMLHKMAAYCARTERCPSDVRKKLTAMGATSDVEERIVAQLTAERFLDEARYCRSFVEDKWRFNRWGRFKIRFELRRRDLPESLIEEALGELIDEEDYRAVLDELLRRKLRAIRATSSTDRAVKLLRYAESKGFERSAVFDCIRAMKDDDIEAPEDID